MEAKYLQFVFSFKVEIWKKVESCEPSTRTEMAYKSLAWQFSLYFETLHSLCDVVLLHVIRVIDDKQEFP